MTNPEQVGAPASVVHQAGEPEGGVQRCELCGTVLADNTALIEGRAVVAQTPREGLLPSEPAWWGVGSSVEMSLPRGSYASRVGEDPTCMPEDPRDGTTHWKGCWLAPGHHNCAVQAIYRLMRGRDDD